MKMAAEDACTCYLVVCFGERENYEFDFLKHLQLTFRLRKEFKRCFKKK